MGQSPSPRREWIEMVILFVIVIVLPSPSPRREWIEIESNCFGIKTVDTSPSPRREWIEMPSKAAETMVCGGLPPHGGSGLK